MKFNVIENYLQINYRTTSDKNEIINSICQNIVNENIFYLWLKGKSVLSEVQIIDITSSFIVLKPKRTNQQIKQELSHFQDVYLVSKDKTKSFKVKILNIDNDKELLFFCDAPKKMIATELRQNARIDFSSMAIKPKLDAKLSNGSHYISKARLNNYSASGCSISILKKYNSFLSVNDSIDIQKTENNYEIILGLSRIVYFTPEADDSLFIKIGLEKIN